MLVNYHLHDINSYDAYGTIEQYIQEAIKNDVKFLGISNHVETVKNNSHVVDIEEAIIRFKKGKEEFLEIKEKYPQVNISYGCELSVNPESRKDIERLIKEVGFDFCIGSVHFVEGYDVAGENVIEICKKYPQEVLMDKYFNALLDGLKWGQFSHIGHFDVIKRFASNFYGEKYDMYLHEKILKEIAKIIIDKNFIVEINCAGIFCPCREPSPHGELVKFLIDNGVKKFTLSSDAHNPSEFMQGLLEGDIILKKYNIKPFHY